MERLIRDIVKDKPIELKLLSPLFMPTPVLAPGTVFESLYVRIYDDGLDLRPLRDAIAEHTFVPKVHVTIISPTITGVMLILDIVEDLVDVGRLSVSTLFGQVIDTDFRALRGRVVDVTPIKFGALTFDASNIESLTIHGGPRSFEITQSGEVSRLRELSLPVRSERLIIDDHIVAGLTHIEVGETSWTKHFVPIYRRIADPQLRGLTIDVDSLSPTITPPSSVRRLMIHADHDRIEIDGPHLLELEMPTHGLVTVVLGDQTRPDSIVFGYRSDRETQIEFDGPAATYMVLPYGSSTLDQITGNVVAAPHIMVKRGA